MIEPGIEKQYEKFISENSSLWEFGNEILYRMCREYPYHEREDVVIGKLWLIGRSYAAAIERRKNVNDYLGDEFYYDVVAPKMLEIGKELDCQLETLRKSNGSIVDDLGLILVTHKYLMDAFHDITGLEKRSLASKYLHFHCHEKFYIYDNRARVSIRKMVKRPNKNRLLEIEDYDKEYGDFVCRMLELQEYLDEKLGVFDTPRKLDDFLLVRKS